MADVASPPTPLPPSTPDALAAGRHRLTAEIGRRLVESCGIGEGASLVLGVSGGADSVALLVACRVLADRGDLAAPHAVYVHHHLRPEADDEACWVEHLCRALAASFDVRHVRPGAHSGNVSEHARRLRYEALTDVARERGASHVAVAHHGDDQLETMLIALCRGAGVDGLRGMPWRRPLDGAVELIRPLLAVRRDDCEAYCRAAGLAWLDDPSNRDPSRARARLRAEVVPVLESLWPDAGRRATAAAESIATARDALHALLDEHFGDPSTVTWSRGRLAELDPAVIAAGLRRAAVHAAPDVADRLGRRLLDPAASAVRRGGAPRAFDWPSGLRVVITNTEVRIEARP